MAEIDDSIFGWPEISYFKDYFLDKISSNPKASAAFKDVNFGNPYDANVHYYSHLFYLPDADY